MKPNPETVVGQPETATWWSQNYRLEQVTGYRLYGLDGVNKVASGEWFDADDDQAAIEVAKALMDGHDCELWEGQRFVTRIKHERTG